MDKLGSVGSLAADYSLTLCFLNVECVGVTVLCGWLAICCAVSLPTCWWCLPTHQAGTLAASTFIIVNGACVTCALAHTWRRPGLIPLSCHAMIRHLRTQQAALRSTAHCKCPPATLQVPSSSAGWPVSFVSFCGYL